MRKIPSDPDFGFRVERDGSLSFTLGAARLAISLDHAYELQYQLAEMLAFIETFEDLEDGNSSASREPPQNIVAFQNYRRKARN